VYGVTGQATNLDEISQGIIAAVEAATAEMLKCELADIGCRFGVCHDKKGTDVEIC
jgi:hypothetical protein